MNRLAAPPLPDWIARELPFERYALDVGGKAMHVMEAGAGRPVLMLHGNPTWGFLWRKVAAELGGEALRLVIPDLIGLGLSEKPRHGGEHTLERHAGWIGSLIDQLDLRGVIFVGQDWGGPIGLRAFAERPERLGGLVLANTAVLPPREGFKSTWFHRFARVPLLSAGVFRLLGFPQDNLGRVQGDPGSMAGAVGRAYRFPLTGLRNNAAPLALARMVPGSVDHPTVDGLRRVGALLERFDGPAALVWGERDPILGRALKRLSEALPRAEITRTQAGHFLQEEVPAELAAAIRSVARQLGNW